jgi:hypothetical protein
MKKAHRAASASKSMQNKRAGVALFLITAALGIVFVHRKASCNLDINLGIENNHYFWLPNDSVGAGVMLNVEKVCPRSSAINTVNNNLPPPKVMPLDQVQGIVKYWHEINCPQQETCKFHSIGQHLLHIAMKRKQTLLTVQVGAMDGRSNDPMHEMFVETKGEHYVQARWRHISPNRKNWRGSFEAKWGDHGPSFPDLRNWLPIMIEPVPQNYQDMTQAYLKIANTSGLGCAVPIHAAVSYDSSKTSCPFCRVNTAQDAPQQCKGK